VQICSAAVWLPILTAARNANEEAYSCLFLTLFG